VNGIVISVHEIGRESKITANICKKNCTTNLLKNYLSQKEENFKARPGLNLIKLLGAYLGA